MLPSEAVQIVLVCVIFEEHGGCFFFKVQNVLHQNVLHCSGLFRENVRVILYCFHFLLAKLGDG